MEGIEDGRAVDDCFHCVFIDRDTRPCPRCANRMRYVPAALGSPGERDSARAAWRRGERSEQLLERLWALGLRPEDLD